MAKLGIAVKDATATTRNMLYEDGNATGLVQVVEITTITGSVVPGVAANNLGKAEDSVAASGDTMVAVATVRRDTPATQVSAAGDYAELSSSSLGTAWVTQAPVPTASGLVNSKLVSAATTNPTIIKASAGQVYGWVITNTSAAFKYVKLHNQSTAPTAGSGVVLPIGIPPNTCITEEFVNGISTFTTGISMTTVAGAADADATAVALNDLLINILYK